MACKPPPPCSAPHQGWRFEDVAAFEKERPLLLQLQRKLDIARQLRNIEFDLREIGADRGVQVPVSAGVKARIEAGLEHVALRLGGRGGAVAIRARGEGRAQRPGDGAVGKHQILQRVHALDQAARGHRQRHAGELVEGVARIAAHDLHLPRRAAVGGIEAQRRERHPQFDCVPAGVVPGQCIDLEVRREIQAVGVCGVDAVGEHPGGVDPDEQGRLARADGVDEHADVVLVVVDRVAPHQLSVQGVHVRIHRLHARSRAPGRRRGLARWCEPAPCDRPPA